MKTFIQLTFIASMALLLSVPAMAQKRSLRKFVNEYRGHAEIHTIGVGAPLIMLASWIIPKEDEETIAAKHLLRKIRHVKVYTLSVDDYTEATNDAIARLKTSLEKEHFESLADIKSDGSVVHVMSRGKEDDLGSVVLMVKDDTDIVFVSLRTHLSLADVSDVYNKFGAPKMKDKKKLVPAPVVADSSATVASKD